MPFWVYFLKDDNDNLYIGQTNNPPQRLKQHSSKSSKTAKFVKDNFENCKVVYTEKFNTRKKAMQREKQLKGWTRAKKEALIAGDLEKLKKL